MEKEKKLSPEEADAQADAIMRIIVKAIFKKNGRGLSGVRKEEKDRLEEELRRKHPEWFEEQKVLN